MSRGMTEVEFVAAYRKYGPMLTRRLASLVRSSGMEEDRWAVAEELSQETFLRAWRFRGQYSARKDAKIGTWVWAIGANVFVDYLRKRKAIMLPGASGPGGTSAFRVELPRVLSRLVRPAELPRVLDKRGIEGARRQREYREGGAPSHPEDTSENAAACVSGAVSLGAVLAEPPLFLPGCAVCGFGRRPGSGV